MRMHNKVRRLYPISSFTIASVLSLSISLATAKKKHHTVYAALASAPKKASAQQNPFAGDPDAATAGRRLFAQHCAECHGQAAEGGKRGPSLRAREVQQAAPGAIFWVLSNGVVRRGMPDWSRLPAAEQWQIVTFLQSLSTSTDKRPSATP